MRRWIPLLRLLAIFIVDSKCFADCAPWHGDRTIRQKGKILCAMHHVSLVKATAFTVPKETIFDEYAVYANIRDCFPNLLDAGVTLTRSSDFPRSIKISYCPKCEEQADKKRALVNPKP
jgi:hypothetical protein